jgi:hypothetical protein
MSYIGIGHRALLRCVALASAGAGTVTPGSGAHHDLEAITRKQERRPKLTPEATALSSDLNGRGGGIGYSRGLGSIACPGKYLSA